MCKLSLTERVTKCGGVQTFESYCVFQARVDLFFLVPRATGLTAIWGMKLRKICSPT